MVLVLDFQYWGIVGEGMGDGSEKNEWQNFLGEADEAAESSAAAEATGFRVVAAAAIAERRRGERGERRG